MVGEVHFDNDAMERLSSGIRRCARQPREDLLRLPTGQAKIERVRAQVDFTGPNDCTILADGHSVKDIPFEPSFADASPSQITEIHNALNAIFVFQPEAEIP